MCIDFKYHVGRTCSNSELLGIKWNSMFERKIETHLGIVWGFCLPSTRGGELFAECTGQREAYLHSLSSM